MGKLVSIIILNWNGMDFTRKCLESIGRNTFYSPYEIIVVDNGSSDGSVEFLRQKRKEGKIKLIENSSNMGFAGGNNQGIDASKGSYIFLLNNDTTVNGHWLASLVRVMDAYEKAGIVGCRLVYPNGKLQHAGAKIDDAGIARNLPEGGEREVEYVTGAALMIKREVIDKIGKLDEGFNPIYFEEVDWCYRAWRAGFSVIYTPDTTIVHHEGEATQKKQTKAWNYFVMNKNRIRFMLLNFSGDRLISALPYEILRVLKSIVLLRIQHLLKAYWINFKNRKEIREKRGKRLKNG
ncbi:MAG: glycosyltransferase family 2 protein [Candidatus Diapherotrites archaeon]